MPTLLQTSIYMLLAVTGSIFITANLAFVQECFSKKAPICKELVFLYLKSIAASFYWPYFVIKNILYSLGKSSFDISGAAFYSIEGIDKIADKHKKSFTNQNPECTL